MHFLKHICKFFYASRGSFLVPMAAGYGGGSLGHYGSRLGPARTPWRILWSPNVARAGATSREWIPPSPSRAG